MNRRRGLVSGYQTQSKSTAGEQEAALVCGGGWRKGSQTAGLTSKQGHSLPRSRSLPRAEENLLHAATLASMLMSLDVLSLPPIFLFAFCCSHLYLYLYSTPSPFMDTSYWIWACSNDPSRSKILFSCYVVF